MEQLGNIASLPGMGFPDLPQIAAAESRGPQDAFVLPGTSAAQPRAEEGAGALAEAALPPGLQQLIFRIAALLQKGEARPDLAQNATLEELVEKIAGLLQGTAAPNDGGGIAPALTSDLAGGLSLQIQEDLPDVLPDAGGDLPQVIAAILPENTVPPAPEMPVGNAVDAAQIEEIAAQVLALKEGAGDAKPSFDPALLQVLKDQLAALPLPGAGADNTILARLKPELVRFLQGRGLGQPEIEHHLANLARDLRPAQKPALPFVELPETAAIAVTPEASPAVQETPVTPPTASETPIAAHHAQIPVKKETDASLPPPPAAQPAPQQLEATARPPAPAQAGLVQLLAQSGDETGFGSAGGGNSDPQPDFSLETAHLKPAEAENIRLHNFSNYLTAARGAPSAAAQTVSLHLQRSIGAKISTMTLQLEPADLGRLDIRLKFDKDGGVKAHLSVEKPETLALLQRDAHHLERVLQQSGLDFDESALSFDLRRQGQQRDFEGFYADRGNAEEFAAQLGGGAERTLREKIAVPAYGYVTQAGVNIMV